MSGKNNIKLNKSIVLVGLMGAGKTSLGKLFAETHNIAFIDSDEEIVKKEGRSITEIFQKSGEDYFREIEREVITELIQQGEKSVIGTGGGAFMNDETRATIKKHALSVFLKADLEVLLNRLGEGEDRPLLEGKDKRAVMNDLMNQRYPVYSQADLTVETKDEPASETLKRLNQALYSRP